jgi:tetratricopeptide (TPR) repeat protein
MQLSLRYHPTAQRPACAALLRGTDAAAWLREIGRWGLPAAQLRCYLVPESIRSVQPAGLLVVTRDGAALPADVLEPYGVEAGRLYLPVHATLWPVPAPGELAAALLWPRQLLHPSRGLVGFDTGDELDLGRLLDLPPPRQADWSQAQTAPARKAQLQQVRVQAPTAAEVVQQLQPADVGSVPLTELPGQATPPTGALQRGLAWTQRGLLRLALGAVQGLQRLFGSRRPAAAPAPGAGSAVLQALVVLAGLALGLLGLLWLCSGLLKGGPFPWGALVPGLVFLLLRLIGKQGGASAGGGGGYAPASRPRSGGAGLLGRLSQRLSGRIENLEQKRQTEIERLLRLFRDNPAEALRYAIPLGGAYQSRGTAPPSATLGPRDTNFNPGALGGGQAADGWDVGPYQFDLLRQYQAAAQQEAAAGHYQKAAYIYAHLLNDFHGAAQALEQGGLFREAAVLHKDHLHNPLAAARCLERGGLLLEAAELFAAENQHEKAGDLYQQLEQPERATRHYEVALTRLTEDRAYLEAAQLAATKLMAPERAQPLLLRGWQESRQAESCLRQYFELAAAAPEADLGAEVRAVYQQRTPPARRVELLQVLAGLSEQHPQPELQATAREVAYEVVSAEAAAGNAAPLQLLHHFLPPDRLLAADVSRYAGRQPRRPAAPAVQAPQLDASIEWRHALALGSQWLAVGIRDERVHLARGNWQGNVEYYSWVATVPYPSNLLLVADEQLGGRVLLRTSAAVELALKQLPQNRYFPQAVRVEAPTWLPPWPAPVGLLPNGLAATVSFPGAGRVQLQHYLADGTPEPPLDFHLAGLDAPDEPAEPRHWPGELLYRGGSFYTYYNRHLFCLGENGNAAAYPVETEVHIYQLVRSAYSPELLLAAAIDNGGFVLWAPTHPGQSAPSRPVAAELTPSVDLQFVGPEHLVAIDLYGAELYRLAPDGQHELVRTIGTSSPFVAVLPTTDRHQFALLETSGRVSLHGLEAAEKN